MLQLHAACRAVQELQLHAASPRANDKSSHAALMATEVALEQTDAKLQKLRSLHARLQLQRSEARAFVGGLAQRLAPVRLPGGRRPRGEAEEEEGHEEWVKAAATCIRKLEKLAEVPPVAAPPWPLHRGRCDAFLPLRCLT